jgi:hypothetical protein
LGFYFVMAGPVPAIHVLRNYRKTRMPGIKPDMTALKAYELTPSTVTARRFCDQHEMSLQTATGRSLP